MKRVYAWKAIQAYYDAGHGFVECRNKFGFTHGAWNKAIKRGILIATPTLFRDRRRRYDWAAVQAYYDEGHTYRECREKFGFCAEAWTKAVKRGELKAKARRIPLHVLLATSTSRKAVKWRLLEAGLLQNVCQDCGLREWLGKPITMHIDHINGVKDDHRLENLRMLCPNCHSQTPTYGGRNAKRNNLLQDPGGTV
jgi:5-methylcytosine-specific restriction endonuclease McrA